METIEPPIVNRSITATGGVRISPPMDRADSIEEPTDKGTSFSAERLRDVSIDGLCDSLVRADDNCDLGKLGCELKGGVAIKDEPLDLGFGNSVAMADEISTETIEPPIVNRSTSAAGGVRVSLPMDRVDSIEGSEPSDLGADKGTSFSADHLRNVSNNGLCDNICDLGKLGYELKGGVVIKDELLDLGFGNSSRAMVDYENVIDSEKLVEESELVGMDRVDSIEGSEPTDLGSDKGMGFSAERLRNVLNDGLCESLVGVDSVCDLGKLGCELKGDVAIKDEPLDLGFENTGAGFENSVALVSFKKGCDSEKLVNESERLVMKIKEECSDSGFGDKDTILATKPVSRILNSEDFGALVKCGNVGELGKSVSESKTGFKINEELFDDKSTILAPKPLSQMTSKEYVESLHGPEVKVESDNRKENKPKLPKKRPESGSETRAKGQNGPLAKKGKVEDKIVVNLVIEDGDFPEDSDWLLVGRTVITGLSTTKGRKLEDNEIVHFTFPSDSIKSRSSSMFTSARAAAASSAIVRFSTKRSGEIGRLPMEWAKCLIPLVNSSKVRVLGRCVAAPASLYLMQEIMLYISFYIHHSIFTQIDKTTWKLDANPNIDSTIYPLLTLFKLLKTQPFQKAEFTPEELDSRKRLLNLEGDLAMLPALKKGRGCLSEQAKDEQAISESSLNKLVGAVDVYNLEEMNPPDTLTCDLRPYQKQALFWMSQLEKGVDVEKAAETLHPCWAAYRITDDRASAIYVNIFSGEATTKFPTAMQMTRGGILADAMGLGKTVMTIALILSKPGWGSYYDQNVDTNIACDTEYVKKRKQDMDMVPYKAKGNTLIICPMALLSQWRDELETHSKPGTISTFVHYGGDRTNDPNVMGKHDVVLTTYGVLTSAYKTDGENSIFHRIEWFRVVLDEAHIIKSSRTQGAQAAFALTSYCRWCLTGTPLQNNLEDLYSLLCFLHVEPWCNWAWWSKLIQKPYENGDQRGMKLIKAILRPLMLRRTKETKDKEGRAILVLPPTNIQVIECEQSEAEFDFYGALFRRSKVQFDQFVAQGKVLHNYANILELLLRLRQCCNHPFLVMSRGDSQEYADLNKLARKFLESNPESATSTPKVPSKAYVEEVIDNIRGGENTECPICLESADDPVFTPCAHRMCRECLLSSWRTPAAGLCPICRQCLKKTDLITCPSDNRFRIDVEKNWKESSKVSKLFECLENIRVSKTGEKSIVFSQWTSFFDLLEIPLKKKGIGYLRFDGRLTQKQRERVLKEFNETTEKTVLLMSLKAGGVGLNLTAASYVFLMDPWWNPAVEEQAIMRIHRIGQKRTVSVRRFIVKDTVEERMQQVQARKQRMIAGALTDEEVRSARLEELKMLFR